MCEQASACLCHWVAWLACTLLRLRRFCVWWLSRGRCLCRDRRRTPLLPMTAERLVATSLKCRPSGIAKFQSPLLLTKPMSRALLTPSRLTSATSARAIQLPCLCGTSHRRVLPSLSSAAGPGRGECHPRRHAPLARARMAAAAPKGNGLQGAEGTVAASSFTVSCYLPACTLLEFPPLTLMMDPVTHSWMQSCCNSRLS